MLAMKKVKNHIKIPMDINKLASPIRTHQTPIIIGLRTYLYIPIATNIFGGEEGAGVPFP